MMGETSEEELYDVFSEQSKALEEGGADAVVLETFTDLEELKIALRAVKENTGCETACTMTFDTLKTGKFKTMMGV
jgi:5-methyltetrahydrofolate--homocysteine methyltransferase